MKAKENKVEKKVKNPKEGYISNKDPVVEGKYAHLHPHLMEYFKQNEKTFAYKESYGFLRMGVTQNENDYVFRNSPFLQSYFKIFYNNHRVLSEKEIVRKIETDLIEKFYIFQKCSLIQQNFRKNIERITEGDKKYIQTFN